MKLFNNLPKRLIAGALIALGIALPTATLAASTVTIEGSMGVANVTNGDTQYAHSVNAAYNQVVKLQVYYHNKELPDSGKIAQNLRVKINIPSTAGSTQTQTATISADNSNTVTDATTVNLNRSDAYLQYIPGSAVWRHNTGTNTNIQTVDTTISDSVVTSGTGLVLENEKPCYNFSATVTVLARVMVPGTHVVKQVEKANESGKWAVSNTASPADTLKYMITYTNTGNSTAKGVIVADNLPPNMTYVPNTTVITNSNYPALKDTSNAVTTGGIIIGDYAPGAVAYVVFQVKVPDASKLACGVTRFTNVGIAHPTGTPEYYNTATTDVTKTCTPPPVTPVYTCDLLTLGQSTNRTVNASVKYTATNGATYKSTSFSWGDNSAANSGTATTASHSYSADGTYNVTANVTFTVNGVDKTVTSAACAKPVTFKTTPPPVTPVYTCDLLTLGQSDNRTVNAGVTYTATNGATYKSTSFNWGDNTTTAGSATSATHTFSKDGTYNVTANVTFTVNGVDKTVTSAKCAQPVTFKTTTPPATPVYSCDLLSVSQGANRSVNASVTYTAKNGATFKTATIDWGDSSTPLTTSNPSAAYTYAKDGTYTITAKILFSVNGKDIFSTSDTCVKSVSFTTPVVPTTPTSLPNTGAGDVIGMFGISTVVGTLGYRLFLSRRLARQ